MRMCIALNFDCISQLTAYIYDNENFDQHKKNADNNLPHIAELKNKMTHVYHTVMGWINDDRLQK